MVLIKQKHHKPSSNLKIFFCRNRALFLVFFLSFFYLTLSFEYGLRIGDEGYLTGGVTRILNGEIPYIDYCQNYSPGMFYLFALFFKFLGSDLLLIRKFWVLLNASSAVLSFALAMRIVPFWIAFLPPVLLTFMPFPMTGSFFIFIPLLNLYLTALYLERRIHPFWYGFIAGITILFRQDVGLVGVIVGFCAITLRKILRHESIYFSVRTAGLFFLGVISTLCPYVYYYWIHSGVKEMLFQLLFAGLQAQKGKSIPFPELEFLILHLSQSGSLYNLILFYGPFAIYGSSVILFIKSSFEKKITTPGALHATILLTGLLILPQASMRSDTEHLFQVLPPSYLLLAYWIAQSLTALKNRSASLAARFSSGVSFMIVASSAIYLCISFLFLFHNYRSPFFTRFSREYKYEILDPPHARVLIPAQDSKFINSIVRFILEHSSKEDFLVGMPYEPIFNFLTGLRNPTRYDIFLPGEMDGSQEQQEEIIRSMATPRLKFIIIRYNELINNQDSGIKKKHLMRYYIPDVYQYILNNFYIERRIGPWVILKRKTIA